MLELEKKEFYNETKCVVKTDQGDFYIKSDNNLDLYWGCDASVINNRKSYIVDKENCEIYLCFDNLFNSMKNSDSCDSFFSPLKDNKIKCYSDDDSIDMASFFEIEKFNDFYKITFNRCKNSKIYLVPTYSVRLDENGRYNGFKSFFLKLYDDLSNYDSSCHQMDFDEVAIRTRKFN